MAGSDPTFAGTLPAKIACAIRGSLPATLVAARTDFGLAHVPSDLPAAVPAPWLANRMADRMRISLLRHRFHTRVPIASHSLADASRLVEESPTATRRRERGLDPSACASAITSPTIAGISHRVGKRTTSQPESTPHSHPPEQFMCRVHLFRKMFASHFQYARRISTRLESRSRHGV